ncbi:MAG TPA: hypothetical protein VM053_07400 [Gemmatimonadaceae bacterium]|nr:hypothetical protein [Gemmatimonadaceae bacterium]
MSNIESRAVTDPASSKSSEISPASRRKGWTEPRITQLPPLNELTLQSTSPIPGGGGTGGGGSTVIP